jgi:hypothetical protein
MNMVGAARWGRGVVTRGVLVLFAYRFNHRFDLGSLVATLIVDVARTGPVKERSSEASMLRQVSNQVLLFSKVTKRAACDTRAVGTTPQTQTEGEEAPAGLTGDHIHSRALLPTSEENVNQPKMVLRSR